MACTTLLVGKDASYDGSTIIARNEDCGASEFCIQRFAVVLPSEQPRHYRSVISHVEIDLPDNPMRYSSLPNALDNEGIWAAAGVNEANVAMTATETITTNPRVLAADPLVELRKAEGKEGEPGYTPEVPGGIGEEDIPTLVLPYIRSAREGVQRLGELLTTYGTYETNGIAFADTDEIWWLETIGGHHWIARRVPEDRCVVMPNQFGLDNFDFEDAFGEQKDCMCSADLREFIRDNRLDLNRGKDFNPRLAFGSHTFHDHIYNTPRAWYMGRCLCPTTIKWDGPDADYGPESDNIPWSFVPEQKITAEDVGAILSAHYQGTPYDPYSAGAARKGIYRPIGINRTGVTAICQIRGWLPEAVQGVEWVCFASTTFGAFLPVYTNADDMPAYLRDVTTEVSTDNFYWNTRLLGALADPCYGDSIVHVERWQYAIACKARRILNEYDAKITETGDAALIAEANEKLADLAKKETAAVLQKVLLVACEHMKNGYKRSDN